MIHTEKGLIPIKNIEVGQKVLTFDGYEEVTNKFEQGVQKLVRIVTQDGDFRCTPNHRMAVATSFSSYEWKLASELVSGDKLISSRDILVGEETFLPEWNYEKNTNSTACKDITIPDLNTDMAWFVGLFHGGGYTYPNYQKNGFNAYVSIVVDIDEYDIAEKAKEQMERFGDSLHVTLKKRKDENSYMVHCQSKQLAWYFDKNLKQANATIRVPEYIMNASSDIRLAYVAGVTDAGGSTIGRPANVVSTVYEPFARDIQNLLYSCGIESRLNIASDNVPSRQGWQAIHTLVLITKRSQKLFDEIPEFMKNIRRTSRSQTVNGFPIDFVTESKIKTKYGLCKNKQFNIDDYEREYGECSFAPVEVLCVEEDIEEETFDIEVVNRHEFFCNGYLTHNSAEICMGDVEDETFFNLKNYDENPERMDIGWMSNNSVVLRPGCNYEDFSYIPSMAKRIIDNGEPGMINLVNIQKYARYGKEKPDKATLTNPCFSGDTLIATADGRGCVSIQQLQEEGKDVPVYSIDPVTGEVSIQWGRNPRITGEGQKLLRIHFGRHNRGEFVDITPNHKFFLNDGRTVEAKDLVKGDSIPQFKKRMNGKDDYVVVFDQKGKRTVEHRMIKEFYEKSKFYETYEEGKYNGFCKTSGVVVHHKDDDKTNNDPENLEITTASGHNTIHNKEYVGEGNPMYGKKHTEETKKLIGSKCSERAKDPEYKKKLSDDQTPELRERSARIMKEMQDRKVKEKYDEFERTTDMRYERISDTEIEIIKSCENDKCKNDFRVSWKRREVCFCSITCANKKKESVEARKVGQKKTFEEKAKAVFHEQVQIYRQLEDEHGEDKVMKKDWESKCKELGITHRFNRNSANPWIAAGWKEFKEMVEDYNHTVESIEELGDDNTVYNITVENNHTLAVVTKSTHNNINLLGIYTYNCGEIPLCSMELCNLAEVFPPRCHDKNVFYKALEYATFYSSAVSLLPTHRPETNAIVSQNRRIGVSISGIAQWANGIEFSDWGEMNYTKITSFLRQGYHIVKDVNSALAKAAGVPESIRLTTVKPSGSISLLAGVTPGMHYPVSRRAIRRMRIGDNSPLVEPLKAAGIPWEKDVYSDNTLVFEFMIDHGDVRPCEEVSPWEQFALLAMLQRFWADNNVSCCLTKDHYVHTSKGFERIDDICTDKETVGFHDHDLTIINSKGEVEKSEQFYYNGFDSTIEVTLDGGRQIRGTAKHKLTTLGEDGTLVWKRLDEITENDWIVGRTGLDKWGCNENVNQILKGWKYERKTSSIDITIPTEITPELGFWLGCLASDGCSLSNDNYISLSQINNDVSEKLIEITEKLFNVKPTVTEDSRSKDLLSITVRSAELNHWVKWLGLYNGKQIPKIIMMSSKLVVKAYIRGLTLDSHIGDKHIVVSSSVEKDILKQLDILLNNFGIWGSLLTTQKEGERTFDEGGKYNTKECFVYTLSDHQAHRYMNMIGFAESSKTKIFTERFGNQKFSLLDVMENVPDNNYRTFFEAQCLPKIKSKYLINHYDSLCSPKTDNISRQTLLQFKDINPEFYVPDHILDPTYRFIKIESITKLDESVETFDISTVDTHSYIANGIISHNTIYFDKEKDAKDIEKLLAMYIPILKSVSMLPHSGHGYAQAPYEPVSKEVYEERLAKYGVPDFSKVKGNVPVGSKFCSGDTCEL